jgi:hypothetical protein
LDLFCSNFGLQEISSSQKQGEQKKEKRGRGEEGKRGRGEEKKEILQAD